MAPPARDLDLTLTEDDILVSVTTTTAGYNDSNNDKNDGVVDEFCSFMFWRQPLPAVDQNDLAAILAGSQGHLRSDDEGDNADDEDWTADFDEFNYWRVPIPQLDITDLLCCLNQL